MLTIYDSFGYDLPDTQRYALIHQAGFDGVQIWWSDGFGRGPGYREAPDIARRAGLTVENIHAPVQWHNDLWLDNLAGDSCFRLYQQCLTDCAVRRIPTMVIHLPGDSFLRTPVGFQRMLHLADLAEELRVNLALENLGNTRALAEVFHAVDSTRVGLCYDSCHHANYAPETDLLALYGHRLMALHLHDNGGAHRQHQLPFDGHIDWQHTMRSITLTGYEGATALEPMAWDYAALTPEAFLQTAHERALRLHNMR